jgi:hypothetical protein
MQSFGDTNAIPQAPPVLLRSVCSLIIGKGKNRQQYPCETVFPCANNRCERHMKELDKMRQLFLFDQIRSRNPSNPGIGSRSLSSSILDRHYETLVLNELPLEHR